MMNGQGQQTEKADIIGETKALAGSNYAFQGIAAVRGLVIAKVLGPSLYGFWSILNAIFRHVDLLSLGSTSGMLRQVPLNQGRGKPEDNVLLIQTCLTWFLLSSSIVALICFLLTFWIDFSPYLWEIRLACLLFVCCALRMFINPKLISERKIYLVSKLNLVYAAVNALMGISLVFFWGITGVLVGMLTANLVVLVVTIAYRHLSLRLSLDFRVLLALMRIGSPIMVLSTTFLLLQSIDKLIIFGMLGNIYIGYFGLASFLSQVIGYIPGAINVVLFPRIMHTLGQSNDRQEIEKYYTAPVLLVACTMPVMIGVFYLNIDLAIIYILPKYIPAIAVLKIFILGLFFFTVWGTPRNLLIAFGKQRQTLVMVLFFLALGTTADIGVIKVGLGIEGVAMASLLIFALIALAANAYVLVCLGKDRREIHAFLFKIYSPFIYALTGLVLLDAIHFGLHPVFGNLIRSLLYLIYMLLLILGVEKRSGIFRKAFGVTRAK
jgi:O-antigen/teichoic acid export membrane protein